MEKLRGETTARVWNECERAARSAAPSVYRISISIAGEILGPSLFLPPSLSLSLAQPGETGNAAEVD